MDNTVYRTLHKTDSVHFTKHTVLKVVSNATVDPNATDILSYSNKETGETTEESCRRVGPERVNNWPNSTTAR